MHEPQTYTITCKELELMLTPGIILMTGPCANNICSLAIGILKSRVYRSLNSLDNFMYLTSIDLSLSFFFINDKN